jgi:hypothetical protein
MPALQGLAVAMPLSVPLRLGLAPHAASECFWVFRPKPKKKPHEQARGAFSLGVRHLVDIAHDLNMRLFAARHQHSLIPFPLHLLTAAS